MFGATKGFVLAVGKSLGHVTRAPQPGRWQNENEETFGEKTAPTTLPAEGTGFVDITNIDPLARKLGKDGET